jgi:hypothetical protein
MRKLFLIAASVVFCLGLVATSSYSAKPGNFFTPVIAPAQNPELDFTIVNQTGYEIKALYIGQSGTGDWAKEDEILKARPFPPGKEYKITFKPKVKAENWDIMATWIDDVSVEWLDLNLTEIDKVTLKYDKEKKKTYAVIE